jgi:hypothetical protein
VVAHRGSGVRVAVGVPDLDVRVGGRTTTGPPPVNWTDPGPLSALAAEVLGAYQGRPHWGKRHPWTVSEVAAGYPRLADFRAVRDRRDPDRVFTNPHLDALLGR